MKKSKPHKKAATYRLTPTAHDLLAAMAEQLGLSLAGVLELAIREKAQREGFTGESS
jgi:predicted HicB family RNase H-like nuclease